MGNILFLEPIAPFRLDLTVWTLRRRPENAVDCWDGQEYRRTLPVQDGLAEIAVTQVGPPESPVLRVVVKGRSLGKDAQQVITSSLNLLLGLRIDMRDFYRVSDGDELSAQLTRRFRGMKPPRFPTVFESLINAIASQEVTRTVAMLLLNRLAKNFGHGFRGRTGAELVFPRPGDLAVLDHGDLRALGFSRAKGRAIIEVAQSIAEKKLDLEGIVTLPDQTAIQTLCALRGVGRWTAEYVLLRGLGRTHIFPGDDAGARNNLQRWLHLKKPPGYATVHRVLRRWKPHGGMIYFHLLLDRLAEAGFVKESVTPNLSARNEHQLLEARPMSENFKVGDHVSWNSEAGLVRGTIKKKITSVITFKGYKVHASKEQPQYQIKSDKTDHIAVHKGSALTKVRKAKRSTG
jgi:DNA-3-methyladenine glycosylase II